MAYSTVNGDACTREAMIAEYAGLFVMYGGHAEPADDNLRRVLATVNVPPARAWYEEIREQVRVRREINRRVTSRPGSRFYRGERDDAAAAP